MNLNESRDQMTPLSWQTTVWFAMPVISAGILLGACQEQTTVSGPVAAETAQQTVSSPVNKDSLNRAAAMIALQGEVSSDAEGGMEGVLVSAREAGGIITVTVVSDADGQYRFPANRLNNGTYSLGIRAAGYDLTGPVEVQIQSGKTTQQDLVLTGTRNLPSQLMNAEWLLSVEKSGASREHFGKMDCVGCHSLTRVMMSKHTAETWPAVLERMKTYGPGGQKLPFDHTTNPRNRGPKGPDLDFASFLASINLSSGDKHGYELQTLPRPTGRATKVVITEYDLPVNSFEPHEVLVDPDGMIWSTDFVGPTLLKLNPATGEFTSYQMPELKPAPATKGSNCLEIDQSGNLWWAGLKQAGAFRFDRKTEEFSAWKLPTGDSPYSHAGCLVLSPDGTVWLQEQALQQVQRLDPSIGEFINAYSVFPDDMTIVPAKTRQPHGNGHLAGSGLGGGYEEEVSHVDDGQRRHATYGSSIDSEGTFYIADIGAGYIAKINPDTKAVTLYETPTLDSGPRRMDMDSQDRLWFAEYKAGKVGMFDTRTNEFKEWSMETPYAGAYDIKADKNGEVWTGGMHTDYLYRLDPATGEVTKYLLPTVNLNIRNLGGIDNSTTPVTVWIGENHGNKLARVEFLE